jgi:hypothetical protein
MIFLGKCLKLMTLPGRRAAAQLSIEGMVNAC